MQTPVTWVVERQSSVQLLSVRAYRVPVQVSWMWVGLRSTPLPLQSHVAPVANKLTVTLPPTTLPFGVATADDTLQMPTSKDPRKLRLSEASKLGKLMAPAELILSVAVDPPDVVVVEN